MHAAIHWKTRCRHPSEARPHMSRIALASIDSILGHPAVVLPATIVLVALHVTARRPRSPP